MVRICMDNKLYLAPIGEKPGRSLDVGTGTGIWPLKWATSILTLISSAPTSVLHSLLGR